MSLVRIVAGLNAKPLYLVEVFHMLGDILFLSSENVSAKVISESTGNQIAITITGKLFLKSTDGKETFIHDFNASSQFHSSDLVDTSLSDEEKIKASYRLRAIRDHNKSSS